MMDFTEWSNMLYALEQRAEDWQIIQFKEKLEDIIKRKKIKIKNKKYGGWL